MSKELSCCILGIGLGLLVIAGVSFVSMLSTPQSSKEGTHYFKLELSVRCSRE